MSRSSAILGAIALALPGLVQAQTVAPDPYTPCVFYPQAKTCEAVYQQALKDTSPAAQSVRESYEKYGRYVKTPAPGLTPDDRKYLADNQIELPFDLNAENLGGLHNVINDPALANPQSRETAVQAFLSRAVQAELYCGLNACTPAMAS